MRLTKKPIQMFYFSGTGNTKLLALELQKTFIEMGYKADLEKMPIFDAVELKEDAHLGIVVPVAIQSTYPIVWEFVDRLPEGNGRCVFFADTMQSFSGGVVGPMKTKLEAKGYQCIGAREFKMANNMMKKESKKEAEMKKNKLAIPLAREYAKDLVEGRAKWGRVPLLSDMMRKISDNQKIWTQMSENITVNHEKCVRCGLCEKNCPMKAIQLVDNKIVVDHGTCISCVRCVNYCPKNAFAMSGKPLIQKKVLPVKEI